MNNRYYLGIFYDPLPRSLKELTKYYRRRARSNRENIFGKIACAWIAENCATENILLWQDVKYRDRLFLSFSSAQDEIHFILKFGKPNPNNNWHFEANKLREGGVNASGCEELELI